MQTGERGEAVSGRAQHFGHVSDAAGVGTGPLTFSAVPEGERRAQGRPGWLLFAEDSTWGT